MASFQDYLTFNGEAEKNAQLAFLARTNLEVSTLQGLAELKTPRHFLVLAEPFCPDCLVFVPLLVKMAQANPHLHFHFAPRRELNNPSYFATPEQQKFVQEHSNIPSVFAMDENNKLIFNEFPETLKAQIQASPAFKESYRQGLYQKELERELLKCLLA